MPLIPTAASLDLSRFFTEYQGAFVLLDVAENHTIRHDPARCARRMTPESTFKIPNALIGLETGVARGPDHRRRWDGKKRPIASWNRDHTLRTAIAHSAVWYFQALAAGVGAARMGKYLREIPYGNADLSGGITRFWLDSSLKISPDEQVTFLKRLYLNDLPFSRRSLAIVKDLLMQPYPGSAILRGKTGTAGDPARGIAVKGWFVGYVTRRTSAHVFATHIVGGRNPSGRVARGITQAILRSRGLL